MKRAILVSAITAFLFMGHIGCKKESDSLTGPTPTENYFPSNEGTYYKFYYSRTDSLGSLIEGTRSTRYMGTKVILSTIYKNQIDSFLVASALEVDTAHFRDTTSGAYYFIDTSGFAVSIEDSTLLQFLPFITIDNEMLAYSFPLQTGKFWTVFKMNLVYPGLPITTLVDVSATVIGKETISLNLLTGQVNKEAMKIKYTLALRKNPLSQATQTFTAHAWLIVDVGPAKWYGSGTIVNAFTGLGIDFGDTTTVVNQSLIDYEIK